MKVSFTLLFVSVITLSSFAQTWNFEAGNNLTRYLFTNSAGFNPSYMKSASGLHLAVSRENKLSRVFVYDVGLAYNQYNNVGDVQSIPFSYQADYMGIAAGIGPSISWKKGLVFSAKFSGALQTLINGNQFLQNHYVDLANDDQFVGLKGFVGFTISASKQVNQQTALFISFQHLDTVTFGNTTLNLIPSTFSFGLKIATK
jgi:hypothetical protein